MSFYVIRLNSLARDIAPNLMYNVFGFMSYFSQNKYTDKNYKVDQLVKRFNSHVFDDISLQAFDSKNSNRSDTSYIIAKSNYMFDIGYNNLYPNHYLRDEEKRQEILSILIQKVENAFQKSVSPLIDILQKMDSQGKNDYKAWTRDSVEKEIALLEEEKNNKLSNLEIPVKSAYTDIIFSTKEDLSLADFELVKGEISNYFNAYNARNNTNYSFALNKVSVSHVYDYQEVG
jgi:hypothetical protein